MPILLVLIFLTIIWLSTLSYFFFELSRHYNTIIKKTHATSLQDVLMQVMHDYQTTKKDIEILKEKYAMIEKADKKHIQKIALVRFNPFEDTGGNQSFILALLDNQNTGVVISGLYSRSGTRWYAKQVVEGKGTEHRLSEHEEKAIKEAK